jgi:hypothetical protein
VVSLIVILALSVVMGLPPDVLLEGEAILRPTGLILSDQFVRRVCLSVWGFCDKGLWQRDVGQATVSVALPIQDMPQGGKGDAPISCSHAPPEIRSALHPRCCGTKSHGASQPR